MQRKTTAISTQRGAWLLGMLTGWFTAGTFVSHRWSLLTFVLIGLYGLVDVDALNNRIRRSPKNE